MPGLSPKEPGDPSKASMPASFITCEVSSVVSFRPLLLAGLAICVFVCWGHRLNWPWGVPGKVFPFFLFH